MTAGRVRLSVAEARELGEAALRGIAYADEEARIIADHVIDAALCGYEYSGLAKILNIPESRHFRQPRRPMAVVRETGVSIAFDGGNNVGMLALYHAARAAIDKAGAHGIALVSVNDAWMSGRSAYFVEMIAKAGLVAIHTVGSSRLVAPPGGAKAALGTNPIAIAVPSAPTCWGRPTRSRRASRGWSTTSRRRRSRRASTRSAFPPSAPSAPASAPCARAWRSTGWCSMRWWRCARKPNSDCPIRIRHPDEGRDPVHLAETRMGPGLPPRARCRALAAPG